MKYEWDDGKLALNLKNHKIHFSQAEGFDWSTAVIQPDTRKEYGEPRFQAYGLIGPRLYCLVFTPRQAAVRVISLRKANRREVQRYAPKTHPAD